MSINSIKATDQNGVGHLAIDGIEDIPNLPAYAKSNNLKLGTDVISIKDGKAYMMTSDYVFHEM